MTQNLGERERLTNIDVWRSSPLNPVMCKAAPSQYSKRATHNHIIKISAALHKHTHTHNVVCTRDDEATSTVMRGRAKQK